MRADTEKEIKTQAWAAVYCHHRKEISRKTEMISRMYLKAYQTEKQEERSMMGAAAGMKMLIGSALAGNPLAIAAVAAIGVGVVAEFVAKDKDKPEE